MEVTVIVQVVINETIGIAIQTARSLTRFEDRGQGRGKLLRCLDKVGTTCVVESPECVNGRVLQDDREGVAEMLR